MTGRFEGRQVFQSKVGEVFAWAAAQACREIHVWDASFADWPLSDEAVLQSLTLWARPGRQLHLLARDFGDLSRQHPRFVRWRRDFGHCVQARVTDPEVHIEAGPLLLAGTPDAWRSLRVFDPLHWRGVLSDTAADFRRERESFDALAQRSSESFASTTLGL
jgi:hypothetical protein